MSGFDHLRDGATSAAWSAAIAELPPGAEVGAHDHLAVVVAHPDDETLGAGGLIADASGAGAQVTVVVASDGDASHPGSSTHDPGQLARLRRAEVSAAVLRLAPQARLVLLGRPDGRLAEDPEGLLDAVADAVGDATMIATTWRGDAHPDHEVCGTVAARVAARTGARLVEFPIWGLHWGRPGETGPLRGPSWVARAMSCAARSAKRDALALYRSQHTPLSPRPGDEPVLTAAMLQHFARPMEVFLAGPPADLPAVYFERLYASDADPWDTQRRFYEQRKREVLLAALPRPTFGSAFEPGCGTGLLTAELALRCDRLFAVDASRTAAEIAARRCQDLDGVEVRTASIPAQWPAGQFDLIVLSEVGYYLADASAVARLARAALTGDGVLVACHWRRPAPGYPSSADEVHALLGAGLTKIVEHVEADFVLDVWSPDPRSVAERDGVITEDGQ